MNSFLKPWKSSDDGAARSPEARGVVCRCDALVREDVGPGGVWILAKGACSCIAARRRHRVELLVEVDVQHLLRAVGREHCVVPVSGIPAILEKADFHIAAGALEG